MLKHGEVNPLNVHGLRELAWCPPHFERVQFDCIIGTNDLTDWIYENLQGRFYIGEVDVPESGASDHVILNQHNISNTTGQVTFFPSIRQTVAAFEIASEATYFSLLLPQFNTL